MVPAPKPGTPECDRMLSGDFSQEEEQSVLPVVKPTLNVRRVIRSKAVH